LALLYFRERGYGPLHQNWRHGRFELDIVATKDAVIHFIEVKTRRGLHFGHPEEAVHEKKLENMMVAAEAYLAKYPHWDQVQYDILSITMIEGKAVEYFLIEDVYL